MKPSGGSRSNFCNSSERASLREKIVSNYLSTKAWGKKGGRIPPFIRWRIAFPNFVSRINIQTFFLYMFSFQTRVEKEIVRFNVGWKILIIISRWLIVWKMTIYIYYAEILNTHALKSRKWRCLSISILELDRIALRRVSPISIRSEVGRRAVPPL